MSQSAAQKAAAKAKRTAAKATKALGTENGEGVDSSAPTPTPTPAKTETVVVPVQFLGDDGLHRIVGTLQEVPVETGESTHE